MRYAGTWTAEYKGMCAGMSMMRRGVEHWGCRRKVSEMRTSMATRLISDFEASLAN